MFGMTLQILHLSIALLMVIDFVWSFHFDTILRCIHQRMDIAKVCSRKKNFDQWLRLILTVCPAERSYHYFDIMLIGLNRNMMNFYILDFHMYRYCLWKKNTLDDNTREYRYSGQSKRVSWRYRLRKFEAMKCSVFGSIWPPYARFTPVLERF